MTYFTRQDQRYIRKETERRENERRQSGEVVGDYNITRAKVAREVKYSWPVNIKLLARRKMP